MHPVTGNMAKKYLCDKLWFDITVEGAEVPFTMYTGRNMYHMYIEATSIIEVSHLVRKPGIVSTILNNSKGSCQIRGGMVLSVNNQI